VRVLFASTRGAGHINPLVPFAHACERAGHAVLVAGPSELSDATAGAGLELWEVDDPPADELGAVWGRVPTLPPDEQNEVVVGEIFGRLNTTAALPRMRDACEQWRPDLVVRDPNEYSSGLAAELHGVPHARVAIGLASVEELSLRLSAAAVDRIRRANGLPPDPDAELLRASPFLSVFPPSFDEGVQPDTHRFRDPAWDEPGGELPAWWEGREDDPLVYVTFGTVAGQFPQSVALYDAALEALAGLPVRGLLTVGRHLDLDALRPTPENVRVERWVPQRDVLPHAAVMVCHGGSGSTLGAIAAGVPLVVTPLFADQPENARRVAELGAGLSVPPNPAAVEESVAAMSDAVRTLLDEPAYAERARALAAEAAAQPPVDDAVALFERLGDG
jgi:UDP:flavonoid glycosyltransferase YjiC (YdhE family)